MRKATGDNEAVRYGIGEWYGRSIVDMAPDERLALAEREALPKGQRGEVLCPPQQRRSPGAVCNKAGGVCSLRRYSRDTSDGDAAPVLCTTCPRRFDEDGLVYEWIGETLLGTRGPVLVPEVGFLERPSSVVAAEAGGGDSVGRIDMVLVDPGSAPLSWCAVEVQAVYFSGDSMSAEFTSLRQPEGAETAYPVGRRRPDFRSSGPKRLMPQLQIKVPALRRWGKKMAVVVDVEFYGALGMMDNVGDVSNCDIAWFVVDYAFAGGSFALARSQVQYTTLERAVEGLTAGSPVSLGEFESRILEKLTRTAS